MEIGFAEAYALWAPHYPPEAHNALMEVEQQALVSLLPDVSGLAALDAGCGTGRYMRLLAARGARRVIGVDRSAAMVAHARGDAIVGDLCALPLASDSIDLVVSGLAMNDVTNMAAAIRELSRVLARGGVLVFSALHPRGADAGWTRTFEAAGRTWSLPAHWHSMVDYEQACTAAGLRVERCVEPAIDGRGAVAVVMRARRP